MCLAFRFIAMFAAERRACYSSHHISVGRKPNQIANSRHTQFHLDLAAGIDNRPIAHAKDRGYFRVVLAISK